LLISLEKLLSAITSLSQFVQVFVQINKVNPSLDSQSSTKTLSSRKTTIKTLKIIRSYN